MLPEAFSTEVGPVIGAIILIRGANPFDLNGLISDNYLPVNPFVVSSVTSRRAALCGGRGRQARRTVIDHLALETSVTSRESGRRADGEINRARGSIDEVLTR